MLRELVIDPARNFPVDRRSGTAELCTVARKEEMDDNGEGNQHAVESRTARLWPAVRRFAKLEQASSPRLGPPQANLDGERPDGSRQLRRRAFGRRSKDYSVGETIHHSSGAPAQARFLSK